MSQNTTGQPKRERTKTRVVNAANLSQSAEQRIPDIDSLVTIDPQLAQGIIAFADSSGMPIIIRESQKSLVGNFIRHNDLPEIGELVEVSVKELIQCIFSSEDALVGVNISNALRRETTYYPVNTSEVARIVWNQRKAIQKTSNLRASEEVVDEGDSSESDTSTIAEKRNELRIQHNVLICGQVVDYTILKPKKPTYDNLAARFYIHLIVNPFDRPEVHRYVAIELD